MRDSWTAPVCTICLVTMEQAGSCNLSLSLTTTYVELARLGTAFTPYISWIFLADHIQSLVKHVMSSSICIL